MATSGNGKTIVLITGSNTGIGYETALRLSQPPNYHILVCSRSPEKGTAAITSLQTLNPAGSFSPLTLDVTSSASINAAFELVSKDYGVIDVLINNAGIISWSTDTLTSLHETFETNTFAPVMVTEKFMPLLLKSSSPRLIHVSSGLGSISFTLDKKSNPYYGLEATSYQMSKAALDMLAACHHVKYEGKGVRVWAYDPGYVVTDLSRTGEKGIQERRDRGAGDPKVSAEGICMLVEGKRDGDVAKLVNFDRGVEGVWGW